MVPKSVSRNDHTLMLCGMFKDGLVVGMRGGAPSHGRGMHGDPVIYQMERDDGKIVVDAPDDRSSSPDNASRRHSGALPPRTPGA